MHDVRGHCSCGQSAYVLSLPRAPRHYQPRRCDCVFCTERSVQYLSDPEGSLSFKTTVEWRIETQGSNQAEFMLCPHCGDLMGVIHRGENDIRGAANVSLASGAVFDASVTVSPKLLGPTEKASRWSAIWCRVDGIHPSLK